MGREIERQILGRAWRIKGNSKLPFFLLFPLSILLLLPSVLLLFLSFSAPSWLLPLRQLLPIQTLSIPNYIASFLLGGGMRPSVLAWLVFPLLLFFPTPSSQSLTDAFPSAPLSLVGRR